MSVPRDATGARLRPIVVRRIDWFRITADLQAAGFTLRLIASLTGISKPTLLDLRNKEADPKAHQGEVLLALWARETGQELAHVPRQGSEFSPRRADLILPTGGEGIAQCPICESRHKRRPANM